MEQSSFQLITQKNPWWFDLLLPCYIVLSLWYLIWMYALSLDWYVWFAIPLFIAEVYRIWFSLSSLITARVLAYPKEQPPLKDRTVDVLIPTLNEPFEVLRNTILGATKINGVQTVYVLDDGKREWVAAICKELQIEYLARGTNEHAKAGNLNYGLRYSTAEFVITLDADHIPEPYFIEKTLGYFRDPKLAFIQTPQTFYNLDSFQHQRVKNYPMWNEQSMFYDSIQPAKNIFNAAFFCGSSAILRREALDEIGGFATGTATEDIHTAIRIHSKGWKSLFLSEILARGLAPADVKEYHKQRVRWGAGSLGLLLRTKDSPLIIKGLSLMQRIGYINSTLAYAQGYVKLFYWFLPIIIIYANHSPFRLPFLVFLSIYLPYFWFSLWMTKLYSRNSYHPFYTEQYNIANIFSNVVALKGVIKVQKKFAVSIKLKRKQENSFIVNTMLGIAGLMLFSELYGMYYWYTHYHFSLPLLLQDTIISGMFWNLFNMIILLSFLRFVYRFNKQKNSQVKLHEQDLPEDILTSSHHNPISITP